MNLHISFFVNEVGVIRAVANFLLFSDFHDRQNLLAYCGVLGRSLRHAKINMTRRAVLEADAAEI